MKKTGMTMLEIVVVIAIVAVLAAVAGSMIRGRVNSAKWSEGKTAMGAIATAIRAYAVEKGESGTYPPTLAELGFTEDDLHGRYFVMADYSITAAEFDEDGSPRLTFTIQCDKADLTPVQMTLDNTGAWTESE